MSENRIKKRRGDCGRKSFISFLLFTGLIILLLSAGCTGREGSGYDGGTIEISSEKPCWSPVMSSIVGIDIKPHYTGDAGEIRYHCHASKGTFLIWNEPDYRIINFGNDAVTRESTLWWSYSGMEENTADNNSGDEKITISIEAISTDSGAVLAEKEYLIENVNSTYCLKNT
jgi:hypothetical protein